MVFFGYQNIMLNISNTQNKVSVISTDVPTWFKVLYIIAIVLVVLLYIYLKERLYKKKVKRSISLLIRYIYLILFSSIISFVALNEVKEYLSNIGLAFCILSTVITSILVKKIIFNVSKSDILSVIGLTLTASMFNALSDKTEIYMSRIIMLFVMLSIYLMQVIIDELKQKGIKNKKYLFYSFLLGIFSGISIILGINPVVYIGVSILIFLIGTNLDNAHITFSRKVTQGISKEKREFLFKIERVNISKLLICVILVVLVATVFIVGAF